MKKILFTISMLTTISSFATNYYVSPTGNNSNDGLTVVTAFQTLEFAANQTLPGDTVFAMNGTYTNSWPASGVLNISNSGTASNRIVYKNYLGHSPLIKLNANNWAGIGINGADYITIDGFEIVGNNDSITLAYALAEQMNTNNPATSGNGIGITREYNNITNKPHHNIIRNCTISKCGGAGIYGYRADYTTIENNTIFECAWYSPYGNSAISLYQCWNSDSLAITKNYIVGNTCYRNENYIPFIYVGSITDGNGIIIDDGRNTQNSSTQGVYLGKTYIANNLIYDNGGRGIHCYLSDNVMVINNTCYKNCQSPSVSDGEFTAYYSDSISFINNIALPDTGFPPIDTYSTSAIVVDHNLWAANSGLANPLGINTITTAPSFVLPSSNSLIADFHLQSSSTAINAGTHSFAPGTDKDGNIRSILDSVDIGCYEFQTTTSINGNSVNAFAIFLFPSPATTTINLKLQDVNVSQIQIDIYNSIGQKIETSNTILTSGKFSLDISNIASGTYFLVAYNNEKRIATNRFTKSE